MLEDHPSRYPAAVAAQRVIGVKLRRLTAAALSQGESPLPDRMRQLYERTNLADDSAYRSAPEALEFARWLDAQRIHEDDWQRWTKAIPLSRSYVTADEARNQAREWMSFAAALERRARNRRRMP